MFSVKKSKEDAIHMEDINDVPLAAPLAVPEDFSDVLEASPSSKIESQSNVFEAKTTFKRAMSNGPTTLSAIEQQEESEDSDSSERSPPRRTYILGIFRKAKANNNEPQTNNEGKWKDSVSMEQNSSRKFGCLSKIFKTRVSSEKDIGETSNSACDDKEKGKGKVTKKQEDQEDEEIDDTSDSNGASICCFKRRNNIGRKKDKEEKSTDNCGIEDLKTVRSKIIDEKMPIFERRSLHLIEIKEATLESIEENEGAEEEVLSMRSTSNESATADVTFQCEDNAVAGPATEHDAEANIEFFRATRNSYNFELSEGLPSPLSPGSSIMSIPEDSEHYNICPMMSVQMIQRGLAAGDNMQQFIIHNQGVQAVDLFFDRYTGVVDNERHKRIANFFAWEEETLEERERKKYSRNILITDIDITEREMKKFRESLKRPGERDILYSTVETALKFVEKLSYQHRKKKGKKGKNKKQGGKREPQRPMLWLVYNRIGNEKVIVCTPGDYVEEDCF